MKASTASTRITGGEWRGRLLTTPTDRLLRPTRAVVREALFNILGDRIVGARLVDLFAGAGTVGFEALSRGAARVVLVDREKRSLDNARQTAQRLDCTSQCEFVVADALRWVTTRPAWARDADLCFIDAPYADDTVVDVVTAVAVAPPAFVVCEHHRARDLPAAVGRLELTRRATYGISGLTFFRRQDADSSTERETT